MKRLVLAITLFGALSLPQSSLAVSISVSDGAACRHSWADPTAAVTFAQEQHASVFRLVLTQGALTPHIIQCFNLLKAAGIRLYLSLQYSADWTTPQTRAWLQHDLPEIATFNPRYVSLGNEPDLYGARGQYPVCVVQDRVRWARLLRWKVVRRRWVEIPWRHVMRYQVRLCHSASAADEYLQQWNALEPLLASYLPNAERVFGETTPLGFSFLRQAFKDGKPAGAQAIGFHAYPYTGAGIFALPLLSAWAESYGLRVLASEECDVRSSRIGAWWHGDIDNVAWQSLVSQSQQYVALWNVFGAAGKSTWCS